MPHGGGGIGRGLLVFGEGRHPAESGRLEGLSGVRRAAVSETGEGKAGEGPKSGTLWCGGCWQFVGAEWVAEGKVSPEDGIRGLERESDLSPFVTPCAPALEGTGKLGHERHSAELRGGACPGRVGDPERDSNRCPEMRYRAQDSRGNRLTGQKTSFRNCVQ